jgi:hypothetical protein
MAWWFSEGFDMRLKLESSQTRIARWFSLVSAMQGFSSAENKNEKKVRLIARDTIASNQANLD